MRATEFMQGVVEGSGNNDNNDFYSGLYAELLGDVNNHSVTDMVNTKNSIKRALESGRLSLADVKSEIHQLESELEKQGVQEGDQQIYKVIAVDKSNALGRRVKLRVKAGSVDEVFERLAASDWYPLSVNGAEVIDGRRLKKGVAEGDKMSRIDLGSALANTAPEWQKFVNSLPPQLAREFVDERPRPDQDDIDFLTPLRLISPQPVSVRVADLLRHPENQATIGRSPDDVVAAVNQRWGLKVPSGKKYDPNPARYRAYAQMAPGTASPSVMADGVILFGAGRFVAAALRGDETMRVWSMTRKPGVSER